MMVLSLAVTALQHAPALAHVELANLLVPTMPYSLGSSMGDVGTGVLNELTSTVSTNAAGLIAVFGGLIGIAFIPRLVKKFAGRHA